MGGFRIDLGFCLIEPMGVVGVVEVTPKVVVGLSIVNEGCEGEDNRDMRLPFGSILSVDPSFVIAALTINCEFS